MFGVTCGRFLVSTHSGTQVFRCKSSLAEEHAVVEVVWLERSLVLIASGAQGANGLRVCLCKQFLVRISGVKIGVQGAAKQSSCTNCSIHSVSVIAPPSHCGMAASTGLINMLSHVCQGLWAFETSGV